MKLPKVRSRDAVPVAFRSRLVPRYVRRAGAQKVVVPARYFDRQHDAGDARVLGTEANLLAPVA